ncbi:MAG: hypothetical protein WAU41_08860, partial [Gaiellaceae bacterium]
MSKGDHVVEAAAGKLETFVRDARRSGGVRAKLGRAFAGDPDFLRKLKPSLIKARAKAAPTGEPAGTPPRAPAGSQIARPNQSGGISPWAVVGIALVAGYALAKAIDWRGHAHP